MRGWGRGMDGFFNPESIEWGMSCLIWLMLAISIAGMLVFSWQTLVGFAAFFGSVWGISSYLDWREFKGKGNNNHENKND